MSDQNYAPSPHRSPNLSDLLFVGCIIAVVDALFASALSVFGYGSTVTALWQGVASTLLGKAAMEGGTNTVLIGLLMHIGVAFTWSAVFLFIVLRMAWARRMLASSWGPAKVAAIYGPFIWLVMSLVVIPLLVQRGPSITVRWLVQVLGHIPFVGFPIAAASAARLGLRRNS